MGRFVATVLACALLAPASAYAEDSRVKTVVVGVAARRGVDEGLALAMSDVVQGVYTEDKSRLVLGREDIKRVLSFEEERAAMGCDSASCLSEIASALDVDRLVTGSIDKVGTSYFVVLTEIDARTVEPLSRVQKRLALDEDTLVIGVQQLARDLMNQSRTAPIHSGGTVGAIMISAEPAGARVLVAGEEKGITPVRIEGLAPGPHKVTLEAEGFAPVEMEVPVFTDKVTEVGGSLSTGAITPEELKAYESAKSSRNLWGWTKLISGGVCGGLGCCGAVGIGGGAGAGVGNLYTLGAAGCATVVALLGFGICGWGALDVFTSPKRPGNKHKITIAPPPGEGELQQLELDAASAPMAH